MKAINIGILGLGTVGAGVVNLIKENSIEISRKLGRDIKIFMVASRDASKARQICDSDTLITDNPFDLIKHPEIEIVIELFGGTTIAKDLVIESIYNKKHVVTANKKLIAEFGNEIFKIAESQNVMVCFEAAVAGGIPIIKALREGLAANEIKEIAGIINGTSNFILTKMCDDGSSFEDVLKEAKELGYAEADPTFDIEGHDAGHKITIMSALAFGTQINFDACYLEGISKLSSKDIQYAEELGYKIKLLGITRKSDRGIEIRVHPTLIPESRLLANVNGVMNAVMVNANQVGETLYYGAGAGAKATASAVVADIIDIVRSIGLSNSSKMPYLAFQSSKIIGQRMLDIDEIISSYYIRVQVKDKPGVLGKIATILAQSEVSIEALIQKGVVKTDIAEVIILTHSTKEKNIKLAMSEIESLNEVQGELVMIRMDSLHVEK